MIVKIVMLPFACRIQSKCRGVTVNIPSNMNKCDETIHNFGRKRESTKEK